MIFFFPLPVGASESLELEYGLEPILSEQENVQSGKCVVNPPLLSHLGPLGLVAESRTLMLAGPDVVAT